MKATKAKKTKSSNQIKQNSIFHEAVTTNKNNRSNGYHEKKNLPVLVQLSSGSFGLLQIPACTCDSALLQPTRETSFTCKNKLMLLHQMKNILREGATFQCIAKMQCHCLAVAKERTGGTHTHRKNHEYHTWNVFKKFARMPPETYRRARKINGNSAKMLRKSKNIAHGLRYEMRKRHRNFAHFVKFGPGGVPNAAAVFFCCLKTTNCASHFAARCKQNRIRLNEIYRNNVIECSCLAQWNGTTGSNNDFR